MAIELREFLAGLATDPRRLAEFMADADAAMEKAELAEDDRKLLKSGNLAAIQARLAGPGAAAPQIVVVVGLEQLQRMYADAMRAMAPAGAALWQPAPGAALWQPAPGAALWQPAAGAVPGAALWQPAVGAVPGAALWQPAAGAVPGAALWQQAPAGAALWQPALPGAALWQQAAPGAALWYPALPGAVAPQVAWLVVPFPFWWR
jgi:hypothetical protein